MPDPFIQASIFANEGWFPALAAVALDVLCEETSLFSMWDT